MVLVDLLELPHDGARLHIVELDMVGVAAAREGGREGGRVRGGREGGEAGLSI